MRLRVSGFPEVAGDRSAPRLSGRSGQRNRKRAARARTGDHADVASVCGDDPLNERQTEAVAFDLSVDGVGAAVERFEDVRQFGCRNTGAMVTDRDADDRLPPFASTLGADADPAIGPALLPRIGDQILD